MKLLHKIPVAKDLYYWHIKLKGKPHRYKFLATKAFEIFIRIIYTQKKAFTSTQKVTGFPSTKKHSLPKNPTLAIVICVLIRTLEEVERIHRLFLSINQLNIQPDIVIIVDDGSPMNFNCPKKFILHRKIKNSGPAAARNIGKKIALDLGAKIIAYTDYDCILDTSWTKEIIEYYNSEKKYSLLSGNTISYNKNWLGKYHNISGTLNGRILENSTILLYGPTCNLAITSEVAKYIDFNETLPFSGEDVEFCFKSNQLGYLIGHVPTMIVYHDYGYEMNFFANIKVFANRWKTYMDGHVILQQAIPEFFNYYKQTKEIPTTEK